MPPRSSRAAPSRSSYEKTLATEKAAAVGSVADIIPPAAAAVATAAAMTAAAAASAPAAAAGADADVGAHEAKGAAAAAAPTTASMATAEPAAAADAAAAAAADEAKGAAALAASGYLAARSKQACRRALPYWGWFSTATADQYDPVDNPRGYIPLAVAENRRASDLVARALGAVLAAPVPEHLLHYQDMRGLAELRAAFAHLAARTFMRGAAVNPQRHVTVLAGAGAVVDQLFHCIAAPRSSVLVPAPWYAAFVNDLRVRVGCTAHPVHLPAWPAAGDDDGADAAAAAAAAALHAALDAAADAAAAEGRPVAALLVTNPDNPTGQIYPRAQVLAMMAWCLRRELHYVSDEVYANSVFDAAAADDFTSAMTLARDEAAGLPGGRERAALLVHVIYALSKDFAASGLRVGVLFSANDALNTALSNLGYFCTLPGPMQYALAQLLSDDAWVLGFLAESRARLVRAHDAAIASLDAVGLGAAYLRARAGVFIWLDLRVAFGTERDDDSKERGKEGVGADDPAAAAAAGGDGGGGGGAAAAGGGARRVIPAATWADEDALFERLARVHRVVLTPGSACAARAPGFFRLCYAWPEVHALAPAARRIRAAVDEERAARGLPPLP